MEEHHWTWLWVVIGILGFTVLALFVNTAPHLTSEVLPEPTPDPRPTPSLVFDIRPPVEISNLAEPRTLITLPTPTFYYSINLNTNVDMYRVLTLTPAQAEAIRNLRCRPAMPPETPYPGGLYGCQNADAVGIKYLDEIVDAGIMTRDEVNEVLNGYVYQTWRSQ